MSSPIDPSGWCGDLGIETTAALEDFHFVLDFLIIITLLRGLVKDILKVILSGIYAGRSIAIWFILHLLHLIQF